MSKSDEKDLWVAWTRDAMSRYSMPEDIDDVEELVDDMVKVSTNYADSMLDEYDDRFDKSRAKRRATAEDEP